MLNHTIRVDLATNAENKLTANENHLQDSDIKHVKKREKKSLFNYMYFKKTLSTAIFMSGILL